jgi:hypothetical protein
MNMAKIEIVRVGHALVAGKRGDNGGAPSKDSVFGIALINFGVVTTLATFGGRRGGMLRFKTYKKADMDKVLAFYTDVKLTGKDKGFAYKDLDAAARDEVLGADFADTLGKMFHKASTNKKLNTRETAKGAEAKAAKAPKAPKYKAPDPKKVFAFPTQASIAAAQAAKLAA